jgi:hypothetical protein
LGIGGKGTVNESVVTGMGWMTGILTSTRIGYSFFVTMSRSTLRIGYWDSRLKVHKLISPKKKRRDHLRNISGDRRITLKRV